MKKVLSVMLSVLIAVLAIVPVLSGVDFLSFKAGAATTRGNGAYATVFTGSDFQDSYHGNDVVAKIQKMMKQAIADGITDEPDAFLFGGDFTGASYGKADSKLTVPRMTEAVHQVYPYYNTNNIVNIQGNHDVYDDSMFNATGLYEFEHFLVYVINTKDYPSSRSSNAEAITNATTTELVATFDKLLAEGETRPIFIATHIPMHYNSRGTTANDGTTSHNENTLSGVLFDAINAYATSFDVIFLFGHNHSGSYDDYIGGSINFLGKGDTILIPTANGEGNYVEKTLNFTYMNYGFIGYSNNVVENASTMGAFEICPDKIAVSRYTADGLKATHNIELINKKDARTVNVAGYNSATLGSATGALATASGFTDPVYTWTSSDNQIANISANGRAAQISYNKAGTATVTVTVTERNDSSKKASDSYTVTVENKTNPQATTVRIATQIVNGKTLEYYETTFGKTVNLIGSYEGLSSNAKASWSSSNSNVATVDQYGKVTFVGTGSANITYTVTDTSKGYTGTATVRFVISTEQKTEYSYEEVANTSFAAGKQYVIVTTRNKNYVHNDTLDSSGTQGVTFYSTEVANISSTSPRTITVSNDSYVWNTVATGTSGVYYLQNASTGMYLAASPKSGDATRADFYLSATVPSISEGGWRVASNGNLWNGTYYWYTRGTGHTNLINSSKDNYVALFERKTSAPTVDIEFAGKSANGTSQNVYSVSNGMTLPLFGRYTNIEEASNVTWTSSNTSVATVDNNGVLTFKGVQGSTTITYKVTDAINGNTVSATVTINSYLGTEPVRTFKYVTKLEAGKKYVVATKAGEIGDAFLISSLRDTTTSLLATPSEIQRSSNNEYFVEVDVNNNYDVWIAESDGNGHYYLKSERDGRYLYADETSNNEGTVSTSTSVGADGDAVKYQWSYSNPGIYNQYVLDGENTYLRSRSAQFVGMGTKSQSAYYFYEESVLDPNGVITSRYEALKEEETRDGICANQTETLVPKAENFPDNSKVTFTWSSDNDAVATIDQNGVLKYTGKPGVVTVTLTSKSQAYDANGNLPEDVTTVEITVTGDNVSVDTSKFVKTDNFVNGEKYILRAVKNNESGSAISIAISGNKTSTSQLPGVEVTATNDTIVNTDDYIVWEAEESSAGSGWFYLKNAKTGLYLYIDKNGDIVNTTADKSDLALLQLYSKNGQYVIRNKATGNLIRYNTAFYESSSGAIFELYQNVETVSGGGDVPVEVEVRKQDYFGSVNITNDIEYRYGIQNGETEQFLAYVRGLQDGYTITWNVSDTSIATINNDGLATYKGKDGYVTVSYTVNGTDFDGNAVSETVSTSVSVSTAENALSGGDYPEYPNQGSVSIDKHANSAAGGTNFQNSGVAEIELSVTGVPVENPVDVVVVLDHSDSMGPEKMQSAIKDTRNFALQLFNKNEKNRIAIVTFDQYRYYYEDLNSQSVTDNSKGTEDKIITGDGTIQNAFVTVNQMDELVTSLNAMENNNTGGTNYDSGLNYAYRILQASKNDPNANEKQVVIFMSDGAATKYNYLKVGDSSAVNDAWVLGDESDSTLATYLNNPSAYPAAQNFNPNGDNWFAVALKTAKGETVQGLPNTQFYNGYNEGMGATIFTIGYAVKANSTEESVLTTIASNPSNYYAAENNLQEAYDRILEQIDNAASNAVVTDKMGEHFNAMFETSYKMGNSTVTLTPAPKFEIGSWTVDAMGNRLEYTVIETITFTTNSNGKLTGAKSSVLGDGIYDIANSKIVGKYVTYDLINETFTWTIGDITRDEVTLKYYAILDGAAEGEREAGVFNTNEYANINYTNFKGNACQRAFPVPSLGWKQAAVSYEFYLVNDAGQPVNLSGVVVPFSERIIIGTEQTKSILLNSSLELSNYTLSAQDIIPSGYELYNENAYYYISISSIAGNSVAEISDSTMTTYFRDGNFAMPYNGRVTDVTEYTNTAVSFAVKNTGGLIPDTVVIDYGLPVRINVLGNDYEYFIGGKLNAIGVQLNSGVILNTQGYATSQLTDAKTTGLVLSNGTASIDGETIVYTPTSTMMNSEVTFYYEYQTADGKYYYTTVTVIPATNIYFEESFFTFHDGDGYTWQDAGEMLEDKFQSEDRPGTFSFAEYDANNSYGMDQAYNDSYTYSLGNAKYTSVDADAFGKEPTAEFTFCGTGFDLFSVTNSSTGAILVTVYKSDGTQQDNFIVQTYYGYSYDEETNTFEPVTDSTEGMYQVPVISSRDLAYDTYRVVIKPLYSTIFDMAKDGSFEIYVDSVRIYNPAGSPDADSVIGGAYIEDGEYNTKYKELRETILDAKTFYDEVYERDEQFSNGSVFIDSIGALDANGFGDDEKFLNAGPNNEVYLAEGQAIAFHLVSDEPIVPSKVELGMKTVGGNSSQVALMNTNDLVPRYVTVSGGHEMYRSLASVIKWDEAVFEATGKYQTKYPIVIVNTSDTILSLTQLKWAFASSTSAELQVVVDSNTPARAYSVAKSVMAEFPYSGEDIKMEWSDTSLKEGAEVTLTITTPVDIAKITIDGIEITECTIDEDGNKVWTYTFVVTESGECMYDIILFANNGKVSQPMVTETITVNENNSVANIFAIILEYIKTILQFFRGMFA